MEAEAGVQGSHRSRGRLHHRLGAVAQARPGTPGARAWHAMQSASLASHVMVSYLPGTGPADVPVLLNTLVERRCGVIVATGASRVQVAGAAKANPGRRFVLVTTSTAAGSAAVPANAVVVPAADAAGRIGQKLPALAENQNVTDVIFHLIGG